MRVVFIQENFKANEEIFPVFFLEKKKYDKMLLKYINYITLYNIYII